MKKLDAVNRTHAVAIAIQEGLIELHWSYTPLLPPSSPFTEIPPINPAPVLSGSCLAFIIQTAFVYLAVILDLFARRAVGYAISRFIDTALCLEALGMAIRIRKPPKGVIHHSDQGVQYAAHDYVKALLDHYFKISMARKGNPYDNAAAESFIKTLKTEEVYLWEYRTLADVQIRLPYFIEEVYNQKRLHSSLGYRPPVEFEEWFSKTQPCPATLTASV